MKIFDKIGIILIIVLIISLAAIMMAWVALVQEKVLLEDNVNNTALARVNNLETNMIDLNNTTRDNQRKLENVTREINSLNKTLREELGLLNAKISLNFLKNELETENNIQELSDNVLNIQEDLFKAYEIDPQDIPSTWEDINTIFNNLHELINNEEREDALILIDNLITKLRTNTNLTREDVCEAAGGEWREFSNACADKCNTSDVCAQALTYSCDCGPNMCWNGLTCQSE
ncbi:MAG: hypothetical protein ACOC1P_00200 [Minisyncoccales bacterium]